MVKPSRGTGGEPGQVGNQAALNHLLLCGGFSLMDFMDLALEEARKAFEEGETPIGAVLVRQGQVLAKGHNHREAKNDISSHAEIEVLKQAGQMLGSWSLEGCTLYVTLEPCLMCAGAILQSRISTLVYGADNVDDGAISKYGLLTKGELLVYRGEKSQESEQLLKNFFHTLRKKNEL